MATAMLVATYGGDDSRSRATTLQVSTRSSLRGSDCTFLEKPPTKRRRTISSGPAGNRIITSPSEPPVISAWNWVDTTSPAFDSTIFNGLVFFEDGSPQSVGQHGSSHVARNDQTQSNTVENGSGPRESDSTPEDSSFRDVRTLHSSHLPPDTGHLSRYVVNSLIAQGGRLDFPRVSLQSTRLAHAANPSLKDIPPVLLHVNHPPPSLIPRLSDRCISWSEVGELLSHKQREHLKALFFGFIQQAFPVLPESVQHKSLEGDDQRDNASLALAASLYATALPFAMHDDHLSATLTDVSDKREQLYSIAVTAILEEAHRPTIELLQACLLLLQKGPTAQHCGLTPEYAWLTSLAVTMARCLGLHYDCSDWNVPLAHKQLRTRLWWATFVMDIWVSLDSPGGRSIGPDDYDVLPVRLGEDTAGEIDIVTRDSRHFYHLVDITRLLSRIHEAYYTVRAARDTSADLFKALELARPLRSDLNECRQRLNTDLPFNHGNDSGINASVHLACSVVSIVLFRALLRPVQTQGTANSILPDAENSAARAVMTGALNSAREAVQLLESMVNVVGPWNAFWHSWSQGNFAILSTFLVQLRSVSTGQNFQHGMSAEVSGLISRWKHAIRIGAGNGGWGHSLMSLALSRLESLLNQSPP
ncbi:hypothetical protein LTR47_002329 [Exophiala xenobiotica]|nr:hypothetical protein LTR47_002329 [Exophiala xenobiotica]